MDKFLRSIDLKNSLLIAWRNQLPQIRLTLFISFAIALGGILFVYMVSRFKGVSPSLLTRDCPDITGSPVYIGMLSNLGIMGWMATTTICFYAASLLGHNNFYRPSVFFLFVSGVLCLLLTFDDAFMLHERVLPRLHISEKVIFLGYLLIVTAYGAYFFRRILQTDYLLLILALFFLGLSAGLDQLLPFSNLGAFVEDSPKFLGIVLWLAYFSRTAFVMVKEGFARRVEGG